MRRLTEWMLGCAAAAALMVTTGARADAPPAATGLTILSYNVEGLPWPVARGRSRAADAIAGQLRALRSAGAQPQVMAVQEAFGTAEKRIGQKAGYAYAAYGPARDLAPDGAAPTGSDRAFERQAHAWKGETIGKHSDSGLAIFSDYPILWVQRVAYPGYACAGWDCLANKGALAVAVQVPGSRRPVVVIDTHLNSGHAAHVDSTRSLYAFERQVDVLRGFVASVAPAGGDVVLAGDFNVGPFGDRRAYLDGHLMSDAGLQVAAVERSCGPHCREADDPGTGEATLRRSKSLIAFRTGTTDPIGPSGAVIAFGRDPRGAMLSDHVGIAMRFGGAPDAGMSYALAMP